MKPTLVAMKKILLRHTWNKVLPCRCGWYQYVPEGWSSSIS